MHCLDWYNDPCFNQVPNHVGQMEHLFFVFSEEDTFQILRKHFILILDLVCPPKPVDCWRQHCKFLAWTLTEHSTRSSITQIVLLTRLDMTDMTSILVVLHVALKSSSLCWNWKSIAVSPNRHRHLSFYTSYDFPTAKSAVPRFQVRRSTQIGSSSIVHLMDTNGS